jgi:hypothetical protein
MGQWGGVAMREAMECRLHVCMYVCTTKKKISFGVDEGTNAISTPPPP